MKAKGTHPHARMLAHRSLSRRGSATRKAKVPAKVNGFGAVKVVEDTGIVDGKSIGAPRKECF